MTKHRLAAAAAALSLALVPLAAHADLAVGTVAPDFTTQGALAGKELPVSLKALLGKGAVVLYFYPKAFTPLPKRPRNSPRPAPPWSACRMTTSIR